MDDMSSFPRAATNEVLENGDCIPLPVLAQPPSDAYTDVSTLSALRPGRSMANASSALLPIDVASQPGMLDQTPSNNPYPPHNVVSTQTYDHDPDDFWNGLIQTSGDGLDIIHEGQPQPHLAAYTYITSAPPLNISLQTYETILGLQEPISTSEILSILPKHLHSQNFANLTTLEDPQSITVPQLPRKKRTCLSVRRRRSDGVLGRAA
ncbi:MAG: hypothetical protein Q9217_002819 [Psora testacea]